MSVNEPQFPGQIWDGLSPTLHDRLDDKGPDYESGDQITAELIATQTYLLQLNSDLSPVPYTRGGTGLTFLGNPFDVLRTNAGGTAIEWAAPSGGGYTQEQIEDFIAALIIDSTTLDWTYNDGVPTLSAEVLADTVVEKVEVAKNDSLVGTRKRINFIEGSNITLTVADDSIDNEIDVTINGSSSGFTQEQIEDFVAALIQNGTGLTWTYNDPANTLTGNVSLSSFTTTDLAEGSNLYFTNERVDDRVAALIQNGTGLTWSYNDPANTFTGTVSLVSFTTTNLAEGINLYYTAARFNSAFGAKTTSDLAEGTNLYYTTARFNSDFSGRTTTDLLEGTNLYFTNERVDDRVAALVISGTGTTWTYNDGANTLKVDVSLASFSTTNLAEGSNLYYTDERVDDRVAALVISGTGTTWTYNDAGNTLKVDVSLSPFSTTNLAEGTNLYYTAARFNTAFAAKSTTDLAEGTNLYFTNERVDDRVAALVISGVGSTWTYNDGANTLKVDVSISPFTTTDLNEGINLYFTNERVDDRIGNLIVDSASIDWTYDDIGNQLTAVVIANTTVQKVAARKNSTGGDIGTRRRLNFIEGSNITLTVADDSGSDELDITITAAAGTLPVAIYEPDDIRTATDNWSPTEAYHPDDSTFFTWSGLSWAPEIGKFVAVTTETGSTLKKAMTSVDGRTWIGQTTPADTNAWTSTAWSPSLGLFVAVSSFGGVGTRVMTSPDGVIWTSRTSAEDNSWTSVAWSPALSLFAAVATDGTHQVMTSPDGIAWTFRTAANAHEWSSICWSPELNLFAAVGGPGTPTGINIMTSPNGITWTARDPGIGRTWTSICWSPELSLFLAVSNFLTSNVVTSPDGITWTSQTGTGVAGASCVCWNPQWEIFLIVTNPGNAPLAKVFISFDGLTWDTQSPAADNAWTSVAWSPELNLYAAVAAGSSWDTAPPWMAMVSGVVSQTSTLTDIIQQGVIRLQGFDIVIPEYHSLVVADDYEISNGFVLELDSNATFQIG